MTVPTVPRGRERAAEKGVRKKDQNIGLPGSER